MSCLLHANARHGMLPLFCSCQASCQPSPKLSPGWHAAASTANTNTQTASATSDSRSAGQADSGGSTTSEAVAEASAGAASGDAGPERFRLPSQASYSKLQARQYAWEEGSGAACRHPGYVLVLAARVCYTR